MKKKESLEWKPLEVIRGERTLQGAILKKGDKCIAAMKPK